MNVLQRLIIEPSERFMEKVIAFVPNLLMSLLLMLVGLVIGGLLKTLFLRIFRMTKVDRLFERSGIVEVLRKGWITDPVSVILSRVIGWITVFAFFVFALRALDVPAVERLLERFLLYLPNVFVAGVTVLLGYLLSNFLGRTALIAAVNAGIRTSGLIARFVEFTVFLLSVTMALEQLGIGPETAVIAFAISYGGIVLALAISFGLAGKEMAKEYLERKLKGEERKDDISHL